MSLRRGPLSRESPERGGHSSPARDERFVSLSSRHRTKEFPPRPSVESPPLRDTIIAPPTRPTSRETRLSGKHKSPGRIRAESQKIAVSKVLLYRVQHPGRHPSRLQMIWRRTSGKRGADPKAGAPLLWLGSGSGAGASR